MSRIGLAAAALMASMFAAGPAGAGTITFDYNGVNVFPGVTGTTTSVGSFSFADSPSSLTLASLTGFSDLQTTTVISGITQQQTTFSFGLADLTSFSATLGAGGVLTSLSLTTRAVGGADPLFTPESFTVTSLATDGAATFNSMGVQLTQGTVTPSAVPEPSSLAACGVAGALGLLAAVRRRGRRAA